MCVFDDLVLIVLLVIEDPGVLHQAALVASATLGLADVPTCLALEDIL